MRSENRERLPFYYGFVTSLVVHVLLAVGTVIFLENAAATASKPQEIFSVTLEGGVNLGGISQVPKEGAKKVLTPESTEVEKGDAEKVEDIKHEEPEEKKELKLTTPSVVDDPEKILAEQKKAEEKIEKEKKAQEEKKEAEKKAKQEEAKLKKKELEDQKKAEEKKKEDEAKKKEEEDKKKSRALRDKQLAATLKRLKNQYEGESADAGEKGFGAAALGGKGMGGGTLGSMEKIGYSNALKNHVKQGWRWLNSSEKLVAKVEVYILQDGRVQNVNIIQKSGNPNFDDSVVRAVFKASPVPPAPEALYEEFKVVTFTFDSTE